jgi:hypothetical protein
MDRRRALSRVDVMRGCVPLLLAGTLVAANADPASAIPAFARKYETSCQTCHIAYPKLNSFGEAFRLLGYKMPGETEAQVKQIDVPLGAPGQKKVFPDAVWPGAIPHSLPLALVSNGVIHSSSALEEPEHSEEPGGEEGELVQERTRFDFVFPQEVSLVAGGTAGEHVAYFGEIAFERDVEDGVVESEVGVEHFDVRFARIIRDSPALNVKVGAFQPELVNTFDHARRLTVTNYDSMFGVQTVSAGGAAGVGESHHGGAGGLSLPAVATGIEAYGIVSHRAFWTAGVVNGLGPGHESFDGNSAKDVYGRVAYKFGGMALDGSNADTYTTNPKNWQEKSLRVGAFAYRGDGSDQFLAGESHEEGPVLIEDRHFSRVGFDVSAFYKDLNLFGAFVRGKDDLGVFAPDEEDPEEPGELHADHSGEFVYEAWFVELDAVLHWPWLHGAGRYERVNLPNEEEAGTWERGVVSATALVRANVKTTVEYAWDLNESKNHDFWIGLGIAF